MDWDFVKLQLKIDGMKDPADILKARTEAGIKAVVRITDSADELSVSVLDTESGEVTAWARVVRYGGDEQDKSARRVSMLEEAMKRISRKSKALQ